MEGRTIVPIEWPVNPWPMGYLIPALACMGLVCFSAMALIRPRYPSSVNSESIIVVAVVAIGMSVFLLRRLWRERWRWRQQMERLEQPPTEVDATALSMERYLHQCRAYDVLGALSRGYVDWPSFSAHLAQQSHVPPRTVLDSRSSASLHSGQDLPDYLLEAEEIPIMGTDQVYWLLAISAVVILGSLGVSGWWPWLSTLMQGPWLIAVVVVMFSLAAVFRRFLVFAGRGVGRPLAVLASPGVLDDQCGRRWVVGEATMFVCMSGEQVHAVVVGPAGRLGLQFDKASSGDFLSLWQRWNHPHPRPEL